MAAAAHSDFHLDFNADNDSEVEDEDLEDGEVKDDDDDEETLPVPFRPKTDLEPGEAPLSISEMEVGREVVRREQSGEGPPAYDPYDPIRLPLPPPGPFMDQWGREPTAATWMPSDHVLCKFYARGHCAFGDTCRFAHPPGFVPRPPPPGFMPGPGLRPPPLRGGFGPRGPPHPPHRFPLPPRPPFHPPGEDSWEAGLLKAKELLKKSGKLKEDEHDMGEVEDVRDVIGSDEEKERQGLARPRTPPTPDPETYFGVRYPPPPIPPVGRYDGPPEPMERVPVPLTYHPSRDEYETYHPPPRLDYSPPLSPAHGSPRGSGGNSHRRMSEADYYDESPRKRELPPLPKERNHAHPPPKIFKGTSAGPLHRRHDDYHRERQSPPPPLRRSSRDQASMERRSREREMRREEITRNRRSRDRDSSRRRERERDRILPYQRSPDGPRPSASEPNWQDPWDRRGRKPRHSRHSSNSSDSSSGSPRERTKPRKTRSASLDSVSSVESYDSQKHGRSKRSSPVIDQKSIVVKNPTGKLVRRSGIGGGGGERELEADLLRAGGSGSGSGREEGREEAVSDASSEGEEAKRRRREELLQQLKAVEDQIAKKRDK